MINSNDKYFIKIEGEVIGPFSLDEISNLRTNNMTLVRNENNEKWEFLYNIKGFKSKKNKYKRYIYSTLFVLIILFVYFYFSNALNSSYSEPISFEELLPPPPTINFTLTKHNKNFIGELFKNCNLSGSKGQITEACNFKDPNVRNVAVEIAGNSPGNFNLGQICDIFDHCKNNWKYVNDPNSQEIIELASNTIANGLNGDCDDFAVLMCSLILSIGGEARINYAYNSESGHAFTEVNIGKSNEDEINRYIFARYKNVENVWSRVDENGNKWLNLDWSADNPGGKYFKFTSGTTFFVLQKYCQDFEAE